MPVRASGCARTPPSARCGWPSAGSSKIPATAPPPSTWRHGWPANATTTALSMSWSGCWPVVVLSESSAGAAASTGAPAASSAGPGEADLPAGTVTFLLTDIEGSTRLWEAAPEAMEVALERHNRLLAEVIGEHGGVVVTSRGEGDSFFAVFASAAAAVEAAGACQLGLSGEAWPTGAALRVRMGLYTGEAHVRGSGRVDHAPINRCARVKAAAHGGQVLVTKTTRDLADGRLG